MDLVAQYADSDEETPPNPTVKINPAPVPSLEATPQVQLYLTDSIKEISYNLPYNELYKPAVGPLNPFSEYTSITKNHLTGNVDEHFMSEHMFRTLERTYQTYGYTLAPDGNGSLTGDLSKAQQNNGALIGEIPKKLNRKRKPKGDVSDVNSFAGPWAGYEDDDHVLEEPEGLDEKVKEWEADQRAKIPVSRKEGADEKSIFHGTELHDYMGRTYMHIPGELNGDPGSVECYPPKKLIHTWTGHTKGVNAIRLFPKSGHLLLSCSMDGRVKLWDVYNNRQCLRTFLGHQKAVRDICFSNDGRRFLSASYDRWIKLWDTETGQCISKFTPKNIPYCVKFHPDEDKQHIFLTGSADKKVYQFDINSGEVTQEYNQHLGPVNTITFYDQNRRFVTTSDDKTMRAWEFDIPVVIKYYADPTMHSMPAMTLSPSKKWIAATSLDNQILLYSASDTLRINSSKRFRGHIVAGYACQPNFSPDERYVSSGDSEGKLTVWEFKTCRIVKRFKAHDGVLMGCEWLPHETSQVVTCSWDGTIKLWD